jgi:hypothetical protein
MSRNDDLKRYTDILGEIQKLEAEKEILREKLLSLGNHATTDFICTVTIQERRQVPGIAKLQESPAWAIIEPMVTIKEVPMVKVQPKGRL